MNQKLFGKTITQLRKRNHLTQSQLAELLSVSDKAISKWETGLGYPEITLLPKLATVLGVSVDYLFSGERKGIAIAGNIIADIIKTIDSYPPIGMLANISQVSMAVGGCVSNTAIDLATIDPSLPLHAIGCVGDDEYGRFMISQLQRRRIHTDGVRITEKAPTAFTDVMSLPSGDRTFFHTRGANALFSPEDIDVSALSCKILHIGYILLLDQFDAPDEEYGTVMARFLHQAQQTGIKTSIDVVSNNSADYASTIIPVLPYCDYVIINEIECCRVWSLDPRTEDGSLNLEIVREAMEKTMAAGVSQKVIVHAKEAGFCLDHDGTFTVIPSLQIPPEQIKGSVGAGDAFCAGCLYGIYHQMSDTEMLEFASTAAACNLFSANSVDGMRTKSEIQEMMNQYQRRKLCL